MTPRKRDNPHHHQYPYHQHLQLQDYESDTQDYHSDITGNHISNHNHLPQRINNNTRTATTDRLEVAPSTPPVRSNEELNLSVVSRHNPSITSILSLAPYAVVYEFSAVTQSWEKTGVEGSMFVCQRTQGDLGEERYCVFVLNRRGLDNFDVPLTDGENVEITEEYVILKTGIGLLDRMNGNGGSDAHNNINSNSHVIPAAADGEKIFGLWIFSEPPPNSTAETRTINARVIKECANHAEQSLKMARERAETEKSAVQQPQGSQYGGMPMGRQISLKELFGQQRAQDDEWSVKVHRPEAADQQQPFQWPQPQPQHQHQHQHQQYHTPSVVPVGPTGQSGGDVLGDLFRRAGLVYPS